LDYWRNRRLFDYFNHFRCSFIFILVFLFIWEQSFLRRL